MTVQLADIPLPPVAVITAVLCLDSSSGVITFGVTTPLCDTSATDVSLLVQVMVLSAALSGIISAVKESVSSMYIVAEVILSDIFETYMG